MPTVTTKTSNDEEFQRLFAGYLKHFTKQAERGLLEFYLEAEPTPASRPRVGRYSTYYGKAYTQFMKDGADSAADYQGLKVEGPVAIFVENVVQRPKTGKLKYPKGDVDNYVKGTLDVMTKSEKFWEDDDQVVLLITGKRYAVEGEEAHVRMYWYEVSNIV